jgi:hypothetical protein
MTFTILGCLLLWAVAGVAASNNEHVLKAGKKGEITLTRPTKVGGRVLQPDTYVVQHRTSGGEYFVRFLELRKVQYHGARVSRTFTEQDNAGQIRCSVEPSPVPIEATTIYTVTENGVPRITRVAIKGEDVIHLIGKAEVEN